MSFSVTPNELLDSFGLSGVVYFPRYEVPNNRLDARTVDFLSQVGLPHDDVFFKAKASIDQEESILLEQWFGAEGGTLPHECRTWLLLAYFAASVIALDPETGKVYEFGEGEPLDTYSLVHRDVESLVYALVQLKKFDENDRSDTDVEQEVERLRARIRAHDVTPFENQHSQWNLILDEILEGIW